MASAAPAVPVPERGRRRPAPCGARGQEQAAGCGRRGGGGGGRGGGAGALAAAEDGRRQGAAGAGAGPPRAGGPHRALLPPLVELGRRDAWLQCLEVFRWMQKQLWYVADNGIYSKLISVMGRKGQIQMAMWLFSQMRNSGCKPDTSVYNSLIGAHVHSRDKSKALAKALGYFEKMKCIERCQPTIVTYNILLRAFAQAGDTKQVDILFKDLDESVVSPDIYTYNGVLDAYGKNGMIKEMESVLLRMKSKECRPNVITFNILIDSYGRKQTFDKMEQVFKSLLRSKERPTHPTFNSMITNYGKARLREKAESVVEKMEELGFKPNYVTQECLVMMYAHCDCVSKARQVFDELVSSQNKVHLSSLNSMLDAYCQARLIGRCRECDGRGPMALGAHEYIPHYYRYTGSYSPFDGAVSYDRIPGRERPFVFAITSRDFLCGFGDGVLRGNLCGLRVAGGGHGDLVGMLQSFSPSVLLNQFVSLTLGAP